MTNTKSSVRKNKRTYTVGDKKKHYKVNATYTEYDNKRSKQILCGWQCDECKRIVTNNYCKCNPQESKAHKAKIAKWVKSCAIFKVKKMMSTDLP